MRMCWYSKCAMYVFSPSLCSSQLDKFARSKPKYLSGDKVFVYCPWAPLSVWRGSVSPVTPSHITCIFFSPSPLSWLYWRLKCSRSESVTLGDKKLVYTLLMPWYSNQLGPCPRVSDNWKENIHLIWRQQKTAAGRLNGFETDPNKSWWRIVAVSDWFRGFLFHSSSELNILHCSKTLLKREKLFLKILWWRFLRRFFWRFLWRFFWRFLWWFLWRFLWWFLWRLLRRPTLLDSLNHLLP